ncbi:caspase-7-like [Myxocyprinus asiaticus]|uniref:caspase-7-like n=1 Tax=Myxocyprinus asiaticus TaxID=70543 RepID=UPI002221FDCE|nr:caspase-7-like [Myxocyprinus asiaticus]
MNSFASEDHRDSKKPCVFEPYKKHKKIGKCLIINNFGSPHLHRVGCSTDENLLYSTFQSLGFHVQVEKNLTADQMVDALTKVSKDNHTDMSCFVCVLMSHGAEGKVLGSDQHSVPIKTLTSTMTSDLCPSLQGKPKLFFLQACRGKEGDPVDETDSPEGEFMSDVPEVDFLCCYSTVEGYFSWRNPDMGSVFIRQLCKMLMDSHLEIIQILIRVNQHVANYFQSYTTELEMHGKKQMQCIASRLTKDFYLRACEKK